GPEADARRRGGPVGNRRVRAGAGRGAAAAGFRPRRRPLGDRGIPARAGAGVAVRGPAEVALAEPSAAADRAGMTAFRGILVLQPARLLTFFVPPWPVRTSDRLGLRPLSDAMPTWRRSD